MTNILRSQNDADVSSHDEAGLPSRPQLGLALGGGAARGWAHIGVVRELEARGIDIDVFVGTSIGAVVAACAAAGKLDALEAFARELTRRRVFALMDISLAGSALLGGARLRRRLVRELGGLAIEALPKGFGAVATEFGSGREVCLTRGDIVESLRASYALPGIFEPRLVAGRWLFDGAMSNPVPVSLCRALGADIVIAVNLTSDLGEEPVVMAAAEPNSAIALAAQAKRGRTRLRRANVLRRRLFARRVDGAPGIASVMVDAFAVAQERIARSRLEIEPPDVLINARPSGVGLFDFHRAAEMIDYGRAAAMRALPNIEGLLKHARAMGPGARIAQPRNGLGLTDD